MPVGFDWGVRLGKGSSEGYDLGLRIVRRLNVHERSYWYRLNGHEGVNRITIEYA